MTEFEYLAVFVSIIFGISVTHILAGTIRSLYRSEKDLTHYLLTIFFFLVLILNWWTGFSWGKQEVWSFDLFLVFIIWAGSHYALVIALFPFNGMGTDIQIQDWQPRPLLIMFIIVALLDYAQTAVRGELFSSPYYVPFTLHYIVLASIAVYLQSERFYRITAWYFLISFFSWALIVRRFLA